MKRLAQLSALFFALFLSTAADAFILAPTSIDSDALNYTNSLTSAGCTITAAQRGALDAYFFGLKAAGNWNYDDNQNLLPDSCIGKVNLAQPTKYPLTLNGSCTFSALNGLGGDGSTCDEVMAVNMNTLKRVSQSSAYVDAYVAAANSADVGVANGGGVQNISIFNATNRNTRVISNTTMIDTGAGVVAGLLWGERTNTTNATTGLNGSIVSNGIVNASAAIQAVPYAIGRSGNSWATSGAGIKLATVGAAPYNQPAKFNSEFTLLSSFGFAVPTPMTVYVAKTGSDNADGTIANPLLTLAKANSSVASGGNIIVNDATPQTYVTSTVTLHASISCGLSCPIIQGTGGTLLVVSQTLTIASGIALDGNGLNTYLIDARSDTGTLTISGVTLEHFTIKGVLADGGSVLLVMNAGTCISDQPNAAICLSGFGDTAGGFNITNSTFTCTNTQYTSGTCGAFFAGAGPSGTFIFNGNTGSSTAPVGFTPNGGTLYLVRDFNVANAQIENNTLTCDTSLVVTATHSPGCNVIVHSVAPTSLGLGTYQSGGETISGNTGTINCNAGLSFAYVGIIVGQDTTTSIPDGYLIGGAVHNNSLVGNSACKTQSPEGILNTNQSSAVFSANYLENLAFIGDKNGAGTYYDNVLVCANNVGALRAVGNNGVVSFIHNTVYQPSGCHAAGLNFSDETETGIYYPAPTNVVAEANILYMDPTNTYPFVLAKAGTTFTTLAYNDYHAPSGVSGNAWQYGTDNYTSLAAWQGAHESTAVGSDPSFIAAGSDNFDLNTGSLLCGLVPPIAGVSLDYLGRAFKNPAAVGAYEGCH